MSPDDPRGGLFEASRAAARPRRSAVRATASSDVKRPVAALVAAASAGVATLIGVAMGPPTSSGPSLSLPHRTAELACASCHGEAGEGTAEGLRAAREACVGCHGPHLSTRAGHRKAAKEGLLVCVDCHQVHKTFGGARYHADTGEAVRFGPRGEVEFDAQRFAFDRDITVPIIMGSACARCHDASRAVDPAARCFDPDRSSQNPASLPSMCFDEHHTAMSTPAENDEKDRRVCRDQHLPDRAMVWELARIGAAAEPTPPQNDDSTDGTPALLFGLTGGVLGFAGMRLASRLRRRKKHQAPPVPIATAERTRLPMINTTTCLGCYACVDACPYDVLEIDRYVAHVARPDACCGLSLCEQVCPNGSLTITEGQPIEALPATSSDLESNDVPGLYLAGDITGTPLIKNAIAQGDHAATRIAAALGEGRSRDHELDLVIVGAGPAGISAALRAKELGLRFEVFDQGSAAQSIRSFPRGKLVFDQPLELPVEGKLWLKEATKEELLTQWLRILRREALPIRERLRFTGATQQEGRFEVSFLDLETQTTVRRTARKLLMCIGQRGSPRKLPIDIPQDVEPMVFYHLADARSFQGQRVVVVGLGDVAMEAAAALAHQPDTRVTIVHRGDGFSRGSTRNIAEIKRLQKAGRVDVRLGATVSELAPGRVELSGQGNRTLEADAVFVLIGSIPPWSTLSQLGVRTPQT